MGYKFEPYITTNFDTFVPKLRTGTKVPKVRRSFDFPGGV